MRPSNVALLYRLQLRPRIVQELFAVAGIAVGVALLCASQIAGTSLNGSIAQLTSGVAGNMRFQLLAREPEGFDARLFGAVQRLPGVVAALPVLEQRINVVGPHGEASAELIGADPRFAHLSGPLLRQFSADQLAHQRAFALPTPLAQSIGLSPLRAVKLQIGGRTVGGFLGAELSSNDIGSLAQSPVALAPLLYAQKLAGMPGRLTRIYVQAAPGRASEVQGALERLASGELSVVPASFDVTLFRQAARPVDQSALLFSAISALIGFLFALNAILFTLPHRRRLVADLRLEGYPRLMILQVLLLDALVRGLVAALLGLLLGDVISLVVFDNDPGYLALAFPVGSQRNVLWPTLALGIGAGLLAACIGVLAALRQLLVRLRLTEPAVEHCALAMPVAAVGGVLCVVCTTVIWHSAPREALLAVVSLIAGLMLLLPMLLCGVLLAFDWLQRPLAGAAPFLAVIELRSPAARARSLAIAATGAIAVFGSVSIQGAHANLQRGLDRSTNEVNAVTALWAAPAGTQNLLATTPFAPSDVAKLARLPGVSGVALYRAGFLGFANSMVWVMAPPAIAAQPIPPGQLVSGSLPSATAKLRQGGWAILSDELATQHDLHIGERFTLPAPHPRSLRIAALSTNLGWPSGAIILNPMDYARAWGSTDVSAYNIALAAGTSAATGQSEVRRALGPNSGLAVETVAQREQRQRIASREGLARLTQISTIVLISAVIAMTAAMGALIWQRRARLADMKVDGFNRGILWRALLFESVLLLGTGCTIGAIFGLYGQLILSHALASVTGFPVVVSLAVHVAVLSAVLVTGVAVAIVAAPGYLAARARPLVSVRG
jgi:putative ABC transport system permease protein